jgi:hypothetical protein
MWLTDRSPRSRKQLLLLACLAILLGVSAPGCSGAPSAEDQAKGKEVFRKKFDDSADKARGKKPG